MINYTPVRLALLMISSVFFVKGMDNIPYPTEMDFRSTEPTLPKSHFEEEKARIAPKDRRSYENRKKTLYAAMHIANRMGSADTFGARKLKKTLGSTPEELSYPSTSYDLGCFHGGVNYQCKEYLKTLNFYNELCNSSEKTQD